LYCEYIQHSAECKREVCILVSVLIAANGNRTEREDTGRRPRAPVFPDASRPDQRALDPCI